jgi:hypothetical protein
MSDIVPFEVFIRKTAAARPEDYPDVAPAELERMKKYLLQTLYKNVHPVRTTQVGGRTVDWIPYDQQPAVRTALEAGRSVPRPPGNEPVPMARITLDDLARAGSLEKYHHKTAPPARPAD